MLKRVFMLGLVSSVSLAAAMMAAGSLAPLAEPLSGAYAGDVVVRSLGEASLVVAIDETGEGSASRLFFVETARPVEMMSLRSAVARVERTQDTLVVTLPREHRSLVFSLAAEGERETPGVSSEHRQKSSRLEVTRFENVRAIREYRGNLTRVLPLNVPLNTITTKGLKAFTAAIDTEYQNYDDGGGSGSGCVRSCSTSCGDGSSCTATCGAGQCGSCSCTLGASCYCR